MIALFAPVLVLVWVLNLGFEFRFWVLNLGLGLEYEFEFRFWFWFEPRDSNPNSVGDRGSSWPFAPLVASDAHFRQSH